MEKNYREVLTSPEVMQIGFRLSKFERGEVSYQIFETLMKDAGISVTPIFVDIDSKKMSLVKCHELKNRILSGKVLPSDVDHYVMSNSRYAGVSVKYDKIMVSVLASYGDEVAKKELAVMKAKELVKRKVEK